MISIFSSLLGRGSLLSCGIMASTVLLSTQPLTAQPEKAPATAGSTPRKAPAPHAARHRKAPPQPTPQEEAAAAAPAQPVLPQWPVNETPSKPSITWDSQGLKIEANNASLHDILNEVSTDTGAKVEGMGADERVFGEYGPGTARDVLSQLLHGSNYNVLMIGDQGEGTPRQVVLSVRRAVGPATANRQTPSQPDDDYAPDEPQAEDQPVQPPMINGRPPMMPPQGPPGAPRTPQQILQELQQRQQQMMEQQQQQQQQH